MKTAGVSFKGVTWSCLVVMVWSLPLFCQDDDFKELKTSIEEKYAKSVPHLWAECVPGVKTHLKTDKKVIALTLDACPSKEWGCDIELLRFLIAEKVPATLFVSGKWVDRFPKTLLELAANPLFEIGNHGLEHRPCSVTGKSVYSIPGPTSVGEIVDEIELNNRKIENTIGHKPIWYRAGTNYYDEIGVRIAESLGNSVVGYTLAGDAGASLNKEEMKTVCLQAKSGDILLCHMNHPESETAEGLMEIIPELRKKGFEFVLLSQYPLE